MILWCLAGDKKERNLDSIRFPRRGAMEDADPGWEELRKEARKIEGDLDVKLSSYAKLGGMLAHGGNSRLLPSLRSLVSNIF